MLVVFSMVAASFESLVVRVLMKSMLLSEFSFLIVVDKLPDMKEMLDFVVNAPFNVNRLSLRQDQGV